MMNIDQACEAFRVLLQEQQTRIANMDTNKTDFSTKEVVTIGVVDGDGIGPYITAHATRVLEKLLANRLFRRKVGGENRLLLIRRATQKRFNSAQCTA